MRVLLLLLLLVCLACKNDPGGGELTGTSSPEAEGRRLNETPPPSPTDTALSGTFGGQSPNAPGQSATTGSPAEEARTATDTAATSTAPPPTRTTT